MKKFLFIFILSGFLFLASGNVSAVNAQVLKFQLDPSTVVKTGVPFQVQVLINTGGVPTTNADAMIVYDPSVISINPTLFVVGSFYPTYSQNLLEGSVNKYLVSGYVKDISSPKSSTTDTLFATISLTALTSGATQLSFDCTSGSTADSNINRASDSTDVISCPLTPLALTITNSGGATTTTTPTPTILPTATATPTLTPTPTVRPTISELPRTGTAGITIAAVGIGTVLTIIGLLLFL